MNSCALSTQALVDFNCVVARLEFSSTNRLSLRGFANICIAQLLLFICDYTSDHSMGPAPAGTSLQIHPHHQPLSYQFAYIHMLRLQNFTCIYMLRSHYPPASACSAPPSTPALPCSSSQSRLHLHVQPSNFACIAMLQLTKPPASTCPVLVSPPVSLCFGSAVSKPRLLVAFAVCRVACIAALDAAHPNTRL